MAVILLYMEIFTYVILQYKDNSIEEKASRKILHK